MGIYLLRNLVAVLLEIHNGVRDFDIDRIDNQFDVERSQKSIGHFHQSICIAHTHTHTKDEELKRQKRDLAGRWRKSKETGRREFSCLGPVEK